MHEQLIDFLESLASYPHGPTKVHSLQTHISWVFIASPFVFKVKKPVNFGFLDAVKAILLQLAEKQAGAV